MTRIDDWAELTRALARRPEDPRAVQRLAHAVRQIAEVVIKDSDPDLDDIVQDVTLRLLGRIEELVHVDYPAGFLRAVIYRRYLDVLRRRRSQVRANEQLGQQASERVAAVDDVGEVTAQRDAVRDLLASLTPEEQELVHARFWRSESIGEIASRLGVPYGTAAVRIFRLLRKLRKNSVLPLLDEESR